MIIADGALVVEGDVGLGDGTHLDILHGPAAQTLPGLIAGSEGSIEIGHGAVAIIDGLVLAERDVSLQGGVLDVIGAVAARNVFSDDATLVARCGNRVVATDGVHGTGSGLAELVSWQELR